MIKGSGKNAKKNKTKSRTSTASRPAKRTKLACYLCRKNKIGCDGTRPTCDKCERRGCYCIYIEGKKRGRPADKCKLDDLAKARPHFLQIQGILNVQDVEICPRLGLWGEGPPPLISAKASAATTSGNPGAITAA